MARLIIPDDFTSQLTLLNNIIAHNTMETGSLINNAA